MTTKEALSSIMSALQAQGEAIQLLLKKQSPQGNTVVSHNISFDKFDPKEEEFSAYYERFENYLDTRGITQPESEDEGEPSGQAEEAAKVKHTIKTILIGCLQRTEFLELKSDIGDRKISDIEYSEILELLRKRHDAKINIQTERHRFLSRIQKANESISDYTTALKLIGQRCKWICTAEECSEPFEAVFQAQFIRGVKDTYIREKLLQMDADTSLSQTLDMATALEAARKENTEDFNSKDDSGSVHRLSRSRYSSKPNKKQENRANSHSRQRSQSRKRHYNKHTSNSKDTFDPTVLKELKLDDLCLACGRNNHKRSECRSVNKLKCHDCGYRGHLSKVCITTLLKRKPKGNDINSVSKQQYSRRSDDSEYDLSQITADEIIYDLNSFLDSSASEKILVSVQLCSKKKTFELDTGSPVSTIPRPQYDKLGISCPLIPCPNIRFRVYNKELIYPEGYVKIPVRYKDRIQVLPLFILREDFAPLLGRSWIRALNIIDLDAIDNSENDNSNINQIDALYDKNTVIKRFPSLFDGNIGKIPNSVCTLELKEGAKPSYQPPRPVPYAILPKVDERLSRWEKQGIITKVDYCEWGTPLVITSKPNDIRICADYKVTVNRELKKIHYPIPKPEELFTKIQGNSWFCILDLADAYLHVELDEDSRKIAAISTHRGTYLVNRLLFGLASAPSLFHRVMAPIIANLEGCISYFDDFLIFGKTEKECRENLFKVLERFDKYNIRLNKEKMKLFIRKIKYLGRIISEKGMETDPEKVEAILATEAPKDLKELQSFLGMVQFYSTFIQDVAVILRPLHDLLHQDTEFIWSQECEQAFKKIKEQLSSSNTLIMYNPNLPLFLETDASPYGLGAILSHKVNSHHRPIGYFSRSLTKAEQNYAHIDREATAIFWATKKLYQYLYGRQFTLVTDNKPLQFIFNPEKHLPSVASQRLLRYALHLRQFDYNIVYREGKKHGNVDYLSRIPIKKDNDEIIDGTDCVYEISINLIGTGHYKTVTTKELKEATAKDQKLTNLIKELQSTKNSRTEFSLYNGIIMRGQRVVIPESLQSYVLNELHHTHCGITKMKAIARSICYWEKIDSDIESIVKSCEECAKNQREPAKAPTHHWEEPTGIWQRIHADYAGPINGNHLLIVIDAFSKWVEAFVISKAPTSETTIEKLREMFTYHGLPYTLVTDNASYFTSEEFQEFLRENGITHLTSPPNHPSTNGMAEKTVQTLKSKIKKMIAENPAHLRLKLQQILFQYRTTPLIDGTTPAERHCGRQLRTRLHLLVPEKSNRAKYNEDAKQSIREFQPGQKVLSRNYYGLKKWQPGTIKERIGYRTYLVQLGSGQVIKRNVDQLRGTMIATTPEEEPKVTPLRETIEAKGQTKRKSVRFQDNPEVELRRSQRIRKPVDRLNL